MSSPIRITATPDGRGCLLGVKAQPGARKSGPAGAWNGLLKVAVTAPAEDGRANEDLARVVAGLFGLKRSAVELVSGARSRVKRFRLAASATAVERKLGEYLT
ncbi:MAG: DUF167 domain-containing protein [Planctomycetota bacterium]